MMNLPTGWLEGTAWWVHMEQAVAAGLVAMLSVMAFRALQRQGFFHVKARRHQHHH
ncbi:hypothetical protein [Zavarzinia sp.]|uniref:hypothetical protein n=1 Tax=Zavarzinia sp. TaxID=2027920 RepID=UPI0035650688